MNKQPEQTAQTRRNLIDAYFALVGKGEAASVGAITERAGYNRCTFYRYFKDVVDLLEQVETDLHDEFRSIVSIVNSGTSMPDMVEAMAGIYQRNGGYLSVLLGPHGDPGFAARVKELVSPMARDRFSRQEDMESVTALRVEFALSAVLATVTKWYELGQPITASELGALMLDLMRNSFFGEERQGNTAQ